MDDLGSERIHNDGMFLALEWGLNLTKKRRAA